MIKDPVCIPFYELPANEKGARFGCFVFSICRRLIFAARRSEKAVMPRSRRGFPAVRRSFRRCRRRREEKSARLVAFEAAGVVYYNRYHKS